MTGEDSGKSDGVTQFSYKIVSFDGTGMDGLAEEGLYGSTDHKLARFTRRNRDMELTPLVWDVDILWRT